MIKPPMTSPVGTPPALAGLPQPSRFLLRAQLLTRTSSLLMGRDTLLCHLSYRRALASLESYRPELLGMRGMLQG